MYMQLHCPANCITSLTPTPIPSLAWRPASKPQQPKQCIVDQSILTHNAGEAKIHVPSSARSHLGLRVNPMPRSDEAAAFFTAVYMAVQEIPHGKVTSYGHIAELIGTREFSRNSSPTST